MLLSLVLHLFWLSAKAQEVGLPVPELITDRQGLPQGFVPGIVQDQQGFMWMATRDGLCRFDGNRFKVFRPALDEGRSFSFSDLRSLYLDRQGGIWIISEQGGISLFDPRTEIFTDFSRRIFGQQPLDAFQFQHALPDWENRLWLAFKGQGLVCFDIGTGQVRWFRHQPSVPKSLASDVVRHVLEDRDGAIWVATDAGLDRFEEGFGNFSHRRPGSQTPLALPENDLYTLYQQPTGEILIGSGKFITKFNPRTGQVQAYPLPSDQQVWYGMSFATDSRGAVYFAQREWVYRFTPSGPRLLNRLTSREGRCASLFIDRSDVLWLGTDGSGIRKYDLRADGFQTMPYQVNFQTDLLTQWLGVPAAHVPPHVQDSNPYHFRYTYDKAGALWLNVGNSTFYRTDPLTKAISKTTFPVPFEKKISPLATDEKGQVWVLHAYRFWRYDSQQQQWVASPYSLDESIAAEILQVVVDGQAFWLATRSRGLIRLDRRTKQLKHYTYRPNDPTSLSNNALFCLSEDPDNPDRLWIGTFGSGLCDFDKRTGKSRRITEQDGLPNNVVYSALPDGQGYLWLGTNKGLCRLDRQTFQTQVYTTEDGLLANEFNRFHYLPLPDGQILMAGVEGFTAFRPARLREDRFQPKVELTELQVNNRVVEPGPDSLLSRPIHMVNQIALPYHRNFVTLRFAALQFNRPGKNRYRYQLEGIDLEWVESAQPLAVYTALHPGEYTLRVNASNTSGQWSPHVRQLAISIAPPWWRAWWAWLLYGLLVGGVAWYGFRLYVNRLQLQQAVTLRQQEARQLRELDELKSRFFTNITHDFRTPLTLILSPLEGLLQELSESPYRKKLALMQRNAEQLLGLINQVMDFSKLDARMLTVQESRGDLVEFVGQIMLLFQQEAAAKSIGLIYQSAAAGDYWFDAGKMERILSNLLANALRFTPVGGKITVSLQVSESVLLTVLDTGVGITQEKLPYIFDRFFQVSEDKADNSSGGTGIGLALVKELVELQRGQITVESELGKGTIFLVSLPLQLAAEIVTKKVINPLLADNGLPTTVVQASDGEPPLILLVEDNLELADFIQDSLPLHYRISLATNGVEGLEQALNELPDIVISDVMMPVMDGYTFCAKLKTDERTSHIPVILLTAKAALDSRLEGLIRGADDYLTKPFHVTELNLRLHNLLERQRRYRERLRQELSQPEGVPSLSSQPTPLDPFLEKLYAIVEAKLDDTSLGVEQLAELLNLSRVHLHRKLKALVGLPAGEVIRNYRLKRATQFLREGLNSSETAYQVGFDSPSYFAKCFREVYQMSPGEFARQS